MAWQRPCVHMVLISEHHHLCSSFPVRAERLQQQARGEVQRSTLSWSLQGLHVETLQRGSADVLLPSEMMFLSPMDDVITHILLEDQCPSCSGSCQYVVIETRSTCSVFLTEPNTMWIQSLEVYKGSVTLYVGYRYRINLLFALWVQFFCNSECFLRTTEQQLVEGGSEASTETQSQQTKEGERIRMDELCEKGLCKLVRCYKMLLMSSWLETSRSTCGCLS